jgi:hypothetical protein
MLKGMAMIVTGMLLDWSTDVDSGAFQATFGVVELSDGLLSSRSRSASSAR